MRPVSRRRSWRPACSWSRSQTSASNPGGAGSAGASPSCASVVIPSPASFSICVRRIPATRLRWSTASQRASQIGLNSQIVAMRDRVRLGRRRVGDELLEPRADAPVVRGELPRAERRLLAGAEEDVDPLRLAALDPRELLVVVEELEDVRGLGRAGELRVERLVGAVRLPQQEVGDAAPALAREDALVDHVRLARTDRVGGRPRGALVVAARILDLEHRHPVRSEALEVGALVLEPLPEDQLGLLVLDLGPLDLATRVRERERRQVLAGEEGRDIGGREVEPVGGDVHPGRVAEAAAVAYSQPRLDAYARRRTCSTTAAAIASTPRRGTVTTGVALPAFV